MGTGCRATATMRRQTAHPGGRCAGCSWTASASPTRATPTQPPAARTITRPASTGSASRMLWSRDVDQQRACPTVAKSPTPPPRASTGSAFARAALARCGLAQNCASPAAATGSAQLRFERKDGLSRQMQGSAGNKRLRQYLSVSHAFLPFFEMPASEISTCTPPSSAWCEAANYM